MAKMTNAQLVDENSRLRAAYEVLERKLVEQMETVGDLKRQLAETQDAHQAMVANRNKLVAQREGVGQATSQPHDTYWCYVRACKQLAAYKGQRVAKYVDRATWEARVAAYRASQA